MQQLAQFGDWQFVQKERALTGTHLLACCPPNPRGLNLTTVCCRNPLEWENAHLWWRLALWRSVLFTDESCMMLQRDHRLSQLSLFYIILMFFVHCPCSNKEIQIGNYGLIVCQNLRFAKLVGKWQGFNLLVVWGWEVGCHGGPTYCLV